MHVMIVTDIFGLTLEIKKLAKIFTQQKNITVSIIDPYKGCEKKFIKDDDAYQAFMIESGHQEYAIEVKNAQKLIDDNIIIFGFSAGASAAWKSSENNFNSLSQIIGFYPSQIRNQLDVLPCCPVTIIFPESEPHFDIDQTIKTLSCIDNVSCFKTRYQHGYMNPSSKNHSSIAEDYFVMKIAEIAENLLNLRETAHLTSKINSMITEKNKHFLRE